MSDDFFVGYLPMPQGLRRRVKAIVALLFVLAVLMGGGAAFFQRGYARSFFEFGETRILEGVVLERPYPMLLVARPGTVSAENANAAFSVYPLVDQFKHGADEHVRGLHGKSVRAQGTLIYRGADTMLELKPGPLEVRTDKPGEITPFRILGGMAVTGEIVDSKCYLGVMNPGQGKVHRACAARCVSGGVPAALVVTGNQHPGEMYFLRTPMGQEIPKEAFAHIGEIVTLTGEVVAMGDRKFLLL